ncbi:MAG: right-handed parallel beta-helix repeat-containing protein, partial [Planctomycetota bacterium]
IANNLSGRDGAGISANWYAEPFISNCTFVGNAAAGTWGNHDNTGFGGGLYVGYHSDANVTDCIFWDNYALEGLQIAVGTSFEFDVNDPWAAKLSVVYSDVKGGVAMVKVDDQCTLEWDVVNNMVSDPMFVTGPLGNYYLSQVSAHQTTDSPCVNAGSVHSSILNLDEYTTRTDEVFDRGTVDMGYHYPLSTTAEPCKLCDLIRDGIINFKDFAKMAMSWLDDGCTFGNNYCDGADFTSDGYVNNIDLGFLADCWLLRDVLPPSPNPSQWLIEPYSVSLSAPYSMSMTARTTYDAWGWDVEYFFECVSDDSYDSDWQLDSTYVVPGLSLGDELCFKVRTRDGVGNLTDWSLEACTSITPDTNTVDTIPPAPAPRIVTAEPNSPNSINLLASQAFDASGVEYYFECVSGGGHDSGWQDEPNYLDVDLIPDTEYCYRVMARDKSPQQNPTIWSDAVCVRTMVPPDTTPPWPDPMEWSTAIDANGMDGRPYEYTPTGGTWDYWATMRADPNTADASGTVLFYFECLDEPDFDSGWQLSNQYSVWLGLSGLTPRFRVRARDMYWNITGWSTIEITPPAQ